MKVVGISTSSCMAHLLAGGDISGAGVQRAAFGPKAGDCRHIHYLCVNSAFLGLRCRELRNPTQRAGHIPLSGLVFAHSRHSRGAFFVRRVKPQAQKSRNFRERSGRCVDQDVS